MKVKVTPPYEGAGSWESEVVLRRPVKIAMDGEVIIAHLLKGGVQVPASWCEAIPEIAPEPGDIVEDYQGTIFVFDPSRSATPFKVSKILARKPKGWEEARPDVQDFYCALGERKADDYKKAAYERFLSAILGVPYGRVG